MKIKKKRRWSRSHKLTRHHDLNKSRGGKTVPENIIRMDKAHHEAWHFLFGDLTFEEVIYLLMRVKRRNLNRMRKEGLL